MDARVTISIAAATAAMLTTPASYALDCDQRKLVTMVESDKAAATLAATEKTVQSGAAGQLALAAALIDAVANTQSPGLKHAREWASRAKAIWLSQAAPDLAIWLQTQGRVYLDRNRCAAALPMLQASYDMTVQLHGRDDSRAAPPLYDLYRLASVMPDAGRQAELAPRLLDLWDRHGVPDNIQATQIFIGAADLHYTRQEYAQAERRLKQALALKGSSSPGPADTRLLMLHLASSYYGQLRFAEAEALIATYGAARIAPPSPTRPSVTSHVRAGDWRAALALGLEQLPGRQADFNARKAHLEAERAKAAKAGNAADVDIRQLIDRAEIDFILARAHLGQLYEHLGEIHHAQGELDQAERYYLEAQAVYGPSRVPNNGNLEHALATLYRMRGDFPRALQLREQALRIQLANAGPAHPDVKDSQAELERIKQALAGTQR